MRLDALARRQSQRAARGTVKKYCRARINREFNLMLVNRCQGVQAAHASLTAKRHEGQRVSASPLGDIDMDGNALMRRIGAQCIGHVLGAYSKQNVEGRSRRQVTRSDVPQRQTEKSAACHVLRSA